MTVTPSSNDLHRMTPVQSRNAAIIQVLLTCAAGLQSYMSSYGANAIPEDKEKAAQLLGALFFQLISMGVHEPGFEADVLLHAKELGFNVEKLYTSKVAHA